MQSSLENWVQTEFSYLVSIFILDNTLFYCKNSPCLVLIYADLLSISHEKAIFTHDLSNITNHLPYSFLHLYKKRYTMH